MKLKLFLMAICFATAFNANAQTEKGNHLIGGAISFSSGIAKDFDDYAKSKTLQINPNYGYFISKNLAIGAIFNFTTIKQETGYTTLTAIGGEYMMSTINTTNKQHDFGLGPFIRYYVDITEKFKFYGQFNGSYGHGKLKSSFTGINTSSTYNAYSANLLPGLAIFPSKNFAIEFGFNLLSYARQDMKDDATSTDKTTYENYSFGLKSFSPVIGVNFHL